MKRWDHIRSIKEVIRHLALRMGAADFLDSRRKRRGLRVDHLSAQNIGQRFEKIYQTSAWKIHSNQRSASGTGSELAATASLRNSLCQVILDLDCEIFLDIGCGDWNWMQSVNLPCPYIGIDIVEEVVARNKEFEREGITFHTLNAVEGPLPVADIAFCREVLFHLSLADSMKLISNIKKSAKWLIATTDTTIWFNSDIRTGDFRMINLQVKPYKLPPPYLKIRDDDAVRGRILGVWPVSAL